MQNKYSVPKKHYNLILENIHNFKRYYRTQFSIPAAHSTETRIKVSIKFKQRIKVSDKCFTSPHKGVGMLTNKVSSPS